MKLSVCIQNCDETTSVVWDRYLRNNERDNPETRRRRMLFALSVCRKLFDGDGETLDMAWSHHILI